ncbi:MAG TPA: response regulator transcription factor [Candidatus Alectryocaccomicrobium excrementavium]|uniref:Stage 0 sporulation protein A homolog n=1 Tax=Candidatus Alectryocaccomicrobium excrementavium TaxID=2840668 RepID=A0A9D1G2Q1_9FIRM|nr:response regulator transcription factor [Candidatus Alectryocaccomicrobium excrementavium]
MRILVVEDEKRLAQALAEILREQRYAVETVYDGAEGRDYALSGQYDLVILDVMLPGADGFAVARAMRAANLATPVLMLTARDELSSKVNGLDSGADDYMTKPFAPEELLARVRALLRRQGEVVMESMEFGDVRLNLATCELSCGIKSVRLGYKEFEVLRMLLARSAAIVPKEDILVKVWGAESDAVDNNVEAYISFSRKKLSFLGSRVSITAVRRIGYRLEMRP